MERRKKAEKKAKKKPPLKGKKIQDKKLKKVSGAGGAAYGTSSLNFAEDLTME